MSGKFRICSAAIRLAAVLAGTFIAAAAPPSFAEERNQNSNVYFLEGNTDKRPEGSYGAGEKTSFTINGFTMVSNTITELSGLRSKALGDFLQRRGSHSRSIQHYEKALKNIPNEADIYFNLGNIYFEEKVYNLAAQYYSIATNKYLLPENFGKTQKYRFLSLIRFAISLKKIDYKDNAQKDAEKVTIELKNSETEISKNYPEIMDELQRLYHIIYGDVFVLPR